VGCIDDAWDGAIIWLVRECGLDAWRIFGRYLTDGSSIHRDINATCLRLCSSLASAS